tara:strand:+ start:275 stop:577 length:303 start_codon:yes stop_codon:yes gene_type:complete
MRLLVGGGRGKIILSFFKKTLDLYWLFAVYYSITKGEKMKKWKTKKAIKSQKKIDKALAKLGDSLGLGKPFFAAQTFDDKTGTWKVCPCCGGDSLIADFI